MKQDNADRQLNRSTLTTLFAERSQGLEAWQELQIGVEDARELRKRRVQVLQFGEGEFSTLLHRLDV